MRLKILSAPDIARHAAHYGADFASKAHALGKPLASGAVELEWRAYIRICRSLKVTRTSRKIGLGDIVSAIATPIARALKLPCIDPATKQLRADSDCARRRDALNRL